MAFHPDVETPVVGARFFALRGFSDSGTLPSAYDVVTGESH
jgi:hypothetical protein